MKENKKKTIADAIKEAIENMLVIFAVLMAIE